MLPHPERQRGDLSAQGPARGVYPDEGGTRGAEAQRPPDAKQCGCRTERDWAYNHRQSDLTVAWGTMMSGLPTTVRASTLDAIGGTPVVRLSKVVPSKSADVLVKLEYFNPTGSYKDRMALSMIEEAEKRGDLRPGMTVVEYTGGSTGSSLAFVCAVKGYPFKVVSSDAFAREKLLTMRAFGADVTIVPSEGGRITPDLIPRMQEEAARIVAQEGAYPTDQLNNL